MRDDNNGDSDGKSVNFIEEGDESSYDFKRLRIRDSDEEDDEYPCMMISSNSRFSEPCLVLVLVEGVKFNMEIDCGAAVSVISLETYRKHFAHIVAANCNSRLVVVNGQRLNIFGKILVNMSINNIKQQVSLIVLDSPNSFVPLFGRNLLDTFFQNWRKVFLNSLSINAVKNCVQQKDMTGHEADLVLKEEQPIFRKAYGVPYKLRDKVVEHLDSLEKQNVISPIQA